MYISHQGLQAIHQEVVNDSLRRSDERRLVEAAMQRHTTDAAVNHPPLLARMRHGWRTLVSRPRRGEQV